MERHIRSVGIINIALGVLGLLSALIYLYISGGFYGILGIKPHQEGFDYRLMPLETLMEVGILVYLLAISPLLVVAGIGLLKWQEWARLLAIPLSAINMLNVPVGTAASVYSLWTLLSPEVEPLFEKPPPGRGA